MAKKTYVLLITLSMVDESVKMGPYESKDQIKESLADLYFHMSRKDPGDMSFNDLFYAIYGIYSTYEIYESVD